jgi:hypothetical protein
MIHGVSAVGDAMLAPRANDPQPGRDAAKVGEAGNGHVGRPVHCSNVQLCTRKSPLVSAGPPISAVHAPAASFGRLNKHTIFAALHESAAGTGLTS